MPTDQKFASLGIEVSFNIIEKKKKFLDRILEIFRLKISPPCPSILKIRYMNL